MNKTKKLSLQKQSKLLLEDQKNLKKLLTHVLTYGIQSDESICIDELNLDCFFTKEQYADLFSNKELDDEDEDDEDYFGYVADNYAPILKSKNWATLHNVVYELVMKTVLIKSTK